MTAMFKSYRKRRRTEQRELAVMMAVAHHDPSKIDQYWGEDVVDTIEVPATNELVESERWW